MANEIKLITFAAGEVTPLDDALIYETATGKGGLISGGTVTIKDSSTLHLAGGHGILCGRKFTIFDSDVPVTLSSSGELLGRIYIKMDLSNSTTPITIEVETGASLTPCQQDANVNITSGIYEINLATFKVDTSTLSTLVNVAPIAYPRNVLQSVDDCVASTNPGDIAGAAALTELNSNIANNLVTGIDYSNPINVTSGSAVTASGLLVLAVGGSAGGIGYIVVNGVYVSSTYKPHQNFGGNLSAIVFKGDTVRAETYLNGTVQSFVLYPFKYGN